MIKKYNQYINEGILDELKGPTDEEIWNNLKNLQPNNMLEKSVKISFLKGIDKALERGADINLNDGYSLFISASHNDLDMVKYLVEHGADISINDESALKVAASKGFLDIVKYLVENGADIHIWKDFPLRQAIQNGHLDVVKYSVAHGCKLSDLDNDVLTRPSQEGFLHIVEYLVENGVDIHNNSDAALRGASFHGKLNVVKYLVEHGADIHVFNNSPIRYAKKFGHLEVVKYLQEQIKKEPIYKKIKRFFVSEGIDEYLIGPTKEELMKTFGVESIYETPEEFLENFLDGDITMSDCRNNVYWYKYGKVIFRLDKDTRYFYMCDKLIKIFKHIYNVSELELTPLLFDFVGEELDWKTWKKEKFYPCYRRILFHNEYK